MIGIFDQNQAIRDIEQELSPNLWAMKKALEFGHNGLDSKDSLDDIKIHKTKKWRKGWKLR